MSDAQLAAKFTGLADGILSEAATRRLIDLCWSADHLADAGSIARASVPR